MHPADAQRLGLQEGANARLSAGDAELIVPVHLSDELMPGVVSLPHGWGHDLPHTRLHLARQRPGVNLNALLADHLRDPLSGNAVLSGAPVNVSAV